MTKITSTWKAILSPCIRKRSRSLLSIRRTFLSLDDKHGFFLRPGVFFRSGLTFCWAELLLRLFPSTIQEYKEQMKYDIRRLSKTMKSNQLPIISLLNSILPFISESLVSTIVTEESLLDVLLFIGCSIIFLVVMVNSFP